MPIDPEKIIERTEDLSGWILPDGTWQACEEWWHIPVLYDLRDADHAALTSIEARQILDSGIEEKIRNFAALAGFIRISRNLIDAAGLSHEQLLTLQHLLEFCDLDAEIGLLGPNPNGSVRQVTIERILKTRNPNALFPTEKSD
jgi:hypothetical protein